MGTALAGAAGAGAAGSAAAAEDYETVTVPAGQREVVRVGDGETFENVLFDVTSRGSGVTIAAYGTGWTIRNVAVRGPIDMGNSTIIGAADTGNGTSRIENVWLGDGAVYEKKGCTGIWVNPEHNGHLEIERVNVQDLGDNAFYCSAPGNSGNGTVEIRDCYSANCWVSHYRLAEGRVENCVAVNDDDRQYRRGRGIWAWAPGTVEVNGCHLAMNGYHYSFVPGANGGRSNVLVSDTEWGDGYHGGVLESNGTVRFQGGNGNAPRDFVPEGCPTSPEDALAGEGSSGDGAADEGEDRDEADLERVLLIDGGDEVTRYEFAVSGAVEPSTDEGASIDDAAWTDDGRAGGAVANWKDAFRFDGDLEELTVDGPATVYLDGEAIDPDTVGEELPHVLEVEGTGEPASYEFTVDGTVEAGDEPANETSVVSGTTIQAAIDEGTHRYRFSGVLTDVTFTDGEATVVVDGEAVDPEAYADDDLLPHALVVDGTAADGESTYSFSVDGAAMESTYAGGSPGRETELEAATVRGTVGDWVDAFWFEGDLEDFTLLGDASVDVEYNARNR